MSDLPPHIIYILNPYDSEKEVMEAKVGISTKKNFFRELNIALNLKAEILFSLVNHVAIHYFQCRFQVFFLVRLFVEL